VVDGVGGELVGELAIFQRHRAVLNEHLCRRVAYPAKGGRRLLGLACRQILSPTYEGRSIKPLAPFKDGDLDLRIG